MRNALTVMIVVLMVSALWQEYLLFHVSAPNQLPHLGFAIVCSLFAILLQLINMRK